ncbi:hypothetical protein GCM10020367_18150 [Streptomyces sannanensis]|uniref:XRE family transcriptional regulator n=1 Tax=Streptomyces sannanensis TaxID=285536 RepID=A0ABP6S8L0_9ACTN
MTRGTDDTDGTAEPRETLAEEMRRIKEASGLSFGRLANRTHYSRSSWERFLNGKQLPTRVAVEQFADAAGEDPAPLLELLGAVAAGGQRPQGQKGNPTEPEAPAAPLPVAGPGPARPAPPAEVVDPGPDVVEPEPPGAAGPSRPRTEPQWRRTGRTVGLLAAGALLGGAATALTVGSAQGPNLESSWTAAHRTPQPSQSSRMSHPPQSRPSDPAAAVEADPGCRGDVCIGREPQSMDCQWDAVTVRTAWLRGMHIQLRYSPGCQAVWGRIENGTVGDTVTIKNRFGREQTAVIRVGTDTYTRMLAVSREAPHDTVAICGAIPSQRERECSPLATVQP